MNNKRYKQQYIHSTAKAIAACFICLSFFSCTKFKDRLDTLNGESGIIKVVKGTLEVGEAQIDEAVTVYAKVGDPAADIKLFISEVEARIVSRGISNTEGYAKDTFNIIVPRQAKIGPGSVYFTLNGAVMPSLAFTVKRPDILFPDKVWVEPFLFTYSDSVAKGPGNWEYIFPAALSDGPAGKAVVNTMLKLTYDKDVAAFYFLDNPRGANDFRIRRLKDGMVTTLAGGGNDNFAATGADLRIENDNYSAGGDIGSVDMKPGPDGKLYFTNRFETPPDPITGFVTYYALIQRLDPQTGKVETVAGNNNRSVANYYSNYFYSYRGLEDGPKDSAMVSSPGGFTFDKNGDLCFLDGGTLLRKLKKDGSIETILGKVSREIFDFEDVDGVTYHVVFYTTLEEHSDGFRDDVRFYKATNMVKAGNGKFYILSGFGAGWNDNIMEVNMDTREASTIVGLPMSVRSDYETGTFKEVGLSTTTTFDVDFDGNILFGRSQIYKMDLQAEIISRMTTFNFFPPEYTSQRQFMQHRQPGNNCIIGKLNRIVFDQFGNLYAGYDMVAADADVRIAKVVIEK